jgi:thiol-disulfide isomerase/thioredoxin
MRGASAQRLGIFAVVAALVVSVAMLLLIVEYPYGPGLEASRQELKSAQVPDVAATTAGAKPLELSVFDQPREVPEIHFIDAEERALTLADFRGKVVLLNIWATWCVPCRKEMPALDRLQAQLGGGDFIVLPLSIDRAGLPAVKRFYEELGLQKLGIYVDSSGAASRALGAPGVPTTLLIDQNGREVARKMGAAEWDGPDMVALIRRQIETRPAAETGARP